MNNWINVNDRLPRHNQIITISGIPSGQTTEVEMDITYHRKAGLVSNITKWKPVMKAQIRDCEYTDTCI